MGFPVSVLVEGDADEAVLTRVLDHVGLSCGTVYGKKGKGYVLARLPNYNQAARFSPWLVVVDLNDGAQCAPDFVRANLGYAAGCMRFRVAVRAVEAWLMADAERLASFLGVSTSRVPMDPDSESDPKGVLVQIAGRSPRGQLREDMVPRAGSGSRVGPGYTGRIKEFVAGSNHPWRPDVAAGHSDSLRRCIASLRTLRACLEQAGGASPP
jgi:hypothetical protein